MAITDLSDVTETLKKLVETGLKLNSATGTFLVSAASPDAAFSSDTLISVHLFHAIESPEYRNLQPTFGTGPVPVRLAPMGLILQYAVTVLTPPGGEDGAVNDNALRQQQFTGYIARAIHDYPVVSPKTQITIPGSTIPITILQGTLLARNATIDFILRPAPKEETISFWSSEETHVARLSLFVEARVAVLDAQPPPFAPGIVLSVGQFVFPSSEPQLLTTSNATWFTTPTGPVRDVVASPARAALFDTPGSDALSQLVPPLTPVNDPLQNILQNNVVTVAAIGLAPGTRSLLLRSQVQNFTATLDLDHPPPGSPPIPNQNWNLSATSTSVTFSVFRDVFDTASQTAKTVLPGIYGVRVIVNDPRSGDVPRPRASNELAFAITPQIVSALPTVLSPPLSPPTLAYAIRVVGAYLNASLDIQLSVGGRALTFSKSTPTHGQFFVPAAAPDNSTDTDTIIAVLLTNDPDSGQAIPPPGPTNPLPIRLVVNGATATPAWITVTSP
jgi:hypothetical protein